MGPRPVINLELLKRRVMALLPPALPASTLRPNDTEWDAANRCGSHYLGCRCIDCTLEANARAAAREARGL